METEKMETEEKNKKGIKKLIALKDFHIFQPPETDIKIEKGEDISNKVPERFLQNLITENVISKSNKGE